MYALYRKGRKNTLIYSHEAKKFADEKTCQTMLNPYVYYWRPIILETKTALKDFLLSQKPQWLGEYEVRPITITPGKCLSPRSLLNSTPR